MNVLFVASEMAPFAKTGGLGDVVGSLPKYLRAQGIDARVVIPHYSMIPGEPLHSFKIQRKSGTGDVHVSYLEYDGVPIYLLRSWPYFVDDGQIYSVWDWDTPRFIYFSQMAVEMVWQLSIGAWGDAPWWADVLHLHDWHTGLAAFLVDLARFNPGWQDLATVMTIHNMAFQGPYASQWLIEEGIPPRWHYALPHDDLRDNLLAIGAAYSTRLNTVSPRHAIELHYPRFGEGLEGVIWARNQDFEGILNGIDIEHYNPATDPHIYQHYDADTFRELRGANKLALQQELGLEVNPDKPLLTFVSRLTSQKGFDFAIPALRHLLATSEVQLVGIGTGDPDIEREFGWLGMNFGWKARTFLRYDPILSQKLFAAADMILVPSRYEPCGLTQMMGMRYGALPLVRETGGLADTVENYDGYLGEAGTGFKFLFEESDALLGTLYWALDTYHNRREAWVRMQERGMRHDWSWEASAKRYIAMYTDAIRVKRDWRNHPY